VNRSNRKNQVVISRLNLYYTLPNTGSPDPQRTGARERGQASGPGFARRDRSAYFDLVRKYQQVSPVPAAVGPIR